MSLQRITRFILSYALVGVVVAGAVVWLAPDVLNHGTTAPRPVEQQLMLSGDGLGVASYADAVASARQSRRRRRSMGASHGGRP